MCYRNRNWRILSAQIKDESDCDVKRFRSLTKSEPGASSSAAVQIVDLGNDDNDIVEIANVSNVTTTTRKRPERVKKEQKVSGVVENVLLTSC